MKDKANTPVRVFIIDDHEMVRVGLQSVLSAHPSIKIIGVHPALENAFEEIQRLKPDVVLLDIRFQNGSGVDLCRRIRKEIMDIKVMMLTSFSDDESICESIRAGANAFLLKSADSTYLVESIHSVFAGNSVLDPTVTARVLNHIKSPISTSSEEARLASLSAQEYRVVELVATGKTNKEIAVALSLSESTIKNYFANALDKLELQRRSQAAVFFTKHASKMHR